MLHSQRARVLGIWKPTSNFSLPYFSLLLTSSTAPCPRFPPLQPSFLYRTCLRLLKETVLARELLETRTGWGRRRCAFLLNRCWHTDDVRSMWEREDKQWKNECREHAARVRAYVKFSLSEGKPCSSQQRNHQTFNDLGNYPQWACLMGYRGRR